MATSWKPLEDGAIAIAHISDPHFGSPRAGEVWRHVNKFLRTLKPKLVLVTGDLVHTPEEKLYDEALNALEGLELDYFVCSGNHDRYVLGNRVEQKLLSTLSRDPQVQKAIDQARTHLNRMVRYVAILIGSILCLFLSMGVALFAGPWIGCTIGLMVGLIAGLIAGICVNQLSAEWFERYLARWIKARIAEFDVGHANALFDETFAKRRLSNTEARPVSLGSGAEKWEIGLLALESSHEADCFARGKIPTDELSLLTTTTQGNQAGGAQAEFDLCVLLVHHHLLPVRALERDRDESATDLVNATCLVNAGTLLEKMAESRVDLVLHGHEHKHNWGTYESLEEGYGPVRVVAAGSATGNDSFEGCDEKGASFNIIILAPDRSVRLRRMLLEGGGWKQDAETDLVLFTPEKVRQSRVRRRALIDTGDVHAEYKSEMVKYVLFTRERDIQLYWLWTNWILKKSDFEHRVTNSTGEPVHPVVVLSGDAGSETIKDAAFVPKAGEDHAWNLRFTVPSQFLNKATIRVSVQYTWQGGGLLTSEDLQALNHDDRLGEFRNQGFEFWTSWTNGQTVAALELHLSLPPEYAPLSSGESAGVQVRVHEQGTEFEAEASALQKQLRSLAKGRYSLRIPYPRVNRDYTLVWKPVSQEMAAKRLETPDFATRFAKVNGDRAVQLLRTFAVPLRNTPFWGCATLALYAKSTDSLRAERIAQLSLSHVNDPRLPDSPKTIDLDHERNLLVQGWWGTSVKEERPKDPQLARDFGFEHDEIALVCVPIRFGLSGATNPPAWGVVRIGVQKKDKEKLSVEMDDATIWMLLSKASSRLLQRFFREES